MEELDKIHVRECLEDATASLEARDGTRAVRSAIAGLTRYFNAAASRHKLRTERLFKNLNEEWPKRGVRLAYADGLCVSYERDHFDADTARMYLAFVRGYTTKDEAGARRARFMNSMFEECLHGVKHVSATVPAHWDVVRDILASARLYFLERTSDGQAEYQEIVGLIGRTLSEPRERAHSVFRDSIAYRMKLNARARAEARRPELARVIRDAFIWPGERDYADFTRRDNRSRVLTTMHFGDYTHALERVGMHTPAGRTVIQLHRGDQSSGEEAIRKNYEERGIKHQISRNGQMSPVRIVSALRKGNVTLAALFDVNGNYGDTVQVSFFGRAARLPKGPVEIAVASRVPIVAFVAFSDGPSEHIQMIDLIETNMLPGERLQDTVQRLAQRLVSFAEKWIRKYPHQWQFIHALPSYFARDVRSSGRVREE